MKQPPSPVPFANELYNIAKTVLPIVAHLLERQTKHSMPLSREFRLSGLPARRNIKVHYGDENNFEFLDQAMIDESWWMTTRPLLGCCYVRQGLAARRLFRFGRSAIAFMSASGHVFVRHAPPPVCAFLNDGFRESDFWETINPELDEPFVEDADAALKPLSFKWGARRLTESLFRDALALIMRASVENPTQRTISVQCATAIQEPLLCGPSNVIDPQTLSGALLDRFVKCSRPLRYQRGSSDAFVNLWASEKSAEQLRYEIELAGDNIVLTSFERLELLEEVRALFASFRFPIDDIFEGAA